MVGQLSFEMFERIRRVRYMAGGGGAGFRRKGDVTARDRRPPPEALPRVEAVRDLARQPLKRAFRLAAAATFFRRFLVLGAAREDFDGLAE